MMDNGKKALLRAAGMGEQVERVERGECPFCGESVTPETFRTALDVREFQISGLCQACQDATFHG